MSEEKEDYAVRAAREWFAETQLYIGGAMTIKAPELVQGAQAALDAAVLKLAAIIRKHVVIHCRYGVHHKGCSCGTTIE